MAGRPSSSSSRWPSGSSGRKGSSGTLAGRLLEYGLRVGVLYALIHLLWLPLQGPFVRLLSVAADAVLAILEHPRILTALRSSDNKIILYSAITGVSRPLTHLNCAGLHTSVVAALAMTLAVPRRSWSTWMKSCGLALALLFVVLIAVCVAQVELAAGAYATTHLGLTIHTSRERILLDWAVRKSSLALVYVAPAFLFLISYLSAKTETRGEPVPKTRRPLRAGKSVFSIGAAIAMCAGIGLVLSREPPSRRVDPEALRKIANLNPSSPGAQFNLASSLAEQDDLAGSLEAYEKALRLDPDLIEAWFGAGNVHYETRAYDRAAHDYEEYLKRDPRNVAVRYNLGNTYVMKGLYPLAARAYEEILLEHSDDAAAHRRLGETLVLLDRRCDAWPHLERSVELDPRLSRDEALTTQVSILRSTCGPRAPQVR